MAKFYESLSDRSKLTWPEIYKKLTGKEWEETTKDKRGIRNEPKLEGIEEIDKLMRQPGRGAWHE